MCVVSLNADFPFCVLFAVEIACLAGVRGAVVVERDTVLFSYLIALNRE